MSDNQRETLVESAKEIIDRLLSASETYFEVLFMLICTLFVLILLWLTRGYDDFATWLMPVLIGIPTVVLFVILILYHISDHVQAFIDEYKGSEIASGFDMDDDDEEGTGSAIDNKKTYRIRLIQILGWMIGLFGIIYLVGFFTGSFLFLAAFAFTEIKEEPFWKKGVFVIGFWFGLLFLFEGVVAAPWFPGYFEIDEILLELLAL